jgi:hypothetical protein
LDLSPSPRSNRETGRDEWLPWLETNFEMSKRNARNYMRLAANRQTSAVLEASSIDAALKQIASKADEVARRDRERVARGVRPPPATALPVAPVDRRSGATKGGVAPRGPGSRRRRRGSREKNREKQLVNV